MFDLEDLRRDMFDFLALNVITNNTVGLENW